MSRKWILLLTIVMALSMTTGVWADSVPMEEGVPATEGQPVEAGSDDAENEQVLPDGWNEDETQYIVDGAPVTGFFLVDEELYYANKAGRVAKGSKILKVGNQKYILKQDVILTGPDIVKFKGSYYYINEQGRIRQTEGFLNYEDNRYYVQNGGKLRTDRRFTVNGNTYLTSGSGKLRTGIVKWKGRYYHFRNNFALNTRSGFVYANGSKYFNKKNGGIATARFVKWKKKYYYAGKNGAIRKTRFKYKKRKVKPNPKTGAISKFNYMVAIGKWKKSPYPYDSYVLIDISKQRLSYYKHGRRRLKCKVVTGNVSAGHGTPKGKFRIKRKSRGVTLTGPGYSSYVSYWMAFIGNSYGMHDASWRGSFGGKIYKYNGSHGCVNMPRWAARKLYHKVSVGTLVIIRK